MYFKKLDMHGFKSFAEPVSIEFDEGITCIVGPNGSGKSNISDAIRWVLGEQSPKALRGGKMDEVIFAGTASRKSRGMAEVTLVIDNSENLLPIDYNEVAITRRMYRSGESEYLINNNHCRLRDIRELIMDTGIGVDGYSLIGQGKIADIVSNKPESRREIFEEAAGIVMYRTRKAEAERKLAASNANLERVNDIVSELEGRIGTLKEDSEKAREYLELRERLKTLEINITLKSIENLELKAEYMKDDASELAAAIDDIREEKEAAEQKSAANRCRLEGLEKLISENNEALLTVIGEINEIESKSRVNSERLSAMDAGEKRLTDELVQVREKLEKEKTGAQALYDNKERLERELESLNRGLSERLAAFADSSAALSEEVAGIDSIKNEIYSLYSTASAKRSEAESLKSLIQSLERRRRELTGEDIKTASDREQAEAALKTAQAELEKYTRERERLDETAAELRRRYNEKLAEEQGLRGEIQSLRLKMGELSSRKKTIEEMEANYDGYNHAVKYIMKSGIRGIRGVAAELMKVPSGYETAIETALGAALQNIVCEDESCAKKAISALKENKAGRLTFLPMASIRGGVMTEPAVESAKGFLGYGTDCVEFDGEYGNVFEYLLGRTVVADNMDNAVKISALSRKGFRVVTLEGEIINAGGAITGGRYRVNTGNLLGRKAEIEKLNAELRSCREDEANKSEQAERAAKATAELSEELLACDESKRAAEIAFINANNRKQIAESMLADIEEITEKRYRELQSIDTESGRSNEMTRTLLEEAAAAEEAALAAERQAEEAMTASEDKRSALDSIGEEITKARMSVTACEEQKNSADAMVARINADIAEFEASIAGKEAELAALRQSRLEITDGCGDIESQLSGKEREKERITTYGAELAEEKSGVTKAQSEILASKESMDEKLLELQNSKYEIEIKQAQNETRLENYKEKLWEDFEVTYIQAMEFRKKEFNMNVSMKESREIKGRIKELGEVNVGAIKEYASVSERYEFLSAQRADILTATASLEDIISEMDKTIRLRFKENFDKIVINFEEIFKELFGGGHAELRLDDENNPLEAGIEIVAQPPGKKLQNINLMSGGEKTMTAIALMFAVLKTKPTPFCILDEVEAALDDANISRFADYLKKFKDIQFTLVTHQKATMEHADVLYGVTMPEQGISKVISLKLGDEFEL